MTTLPATTAPTASRNTVVPEEAREVDATFVCLPRFVPGICSVQVLGMRITPGRPSK